PDACPAIVDEYAAKDARVVPVHQPNGGYGRAVNHGISLAKGQYIGIIESDDWIEPTMYEKLYRRAEETGADVVKAMFWKYDSTLPPAEQNTLYAGRVADLQHAPDSPFCPKDWPPIFAFHASLWSNLYRADFLRQIPIIETAGAGYQDLPFIMEVLARAKSISIVKEPLLHYRVEAGQGSSTTCNDERLLRMPAMSQRAREVLDELGILPSVKEAFYLQVFLANATFMRSIRKDLSQQYFDAYHNVLAPLVSDADFSYRYFSRKEKCRARIIAAGGSVRNLKKRWGIFRRPGGITLRLNGRDFDL
ncbi:MAG: glycosyltransferase, partial [bacterium]|nr:glycosyltransferase [bacterium]